MKKYIQFGTLQEADSQSEGLVKGDIDMEKSYITKENFAKVFKNDKDFNEIKELWKNGDQDEAARLFRARLSKIGDKKLGTSLTLMISGAALAAAGYNVLNQPPKVTPPVGPDTPDVDLVKVHKGDTMYQMAADKLGPGHSSKEIMDYCHQISDANGFDFRLFGRPAHSANWYSMDAIKGLVKDPDYLLPGWKLIMPPIK